MRSLTISESEIREKSKVLLKSFSMGKKEACIISGQYIHK